MSRKCSPTRELESTWHYLLASGALSEHPTFIARAKFTHVNHNKFVMTINHCQKKNCSAFFCFVFRWRLLIYKPPLQWVYRPSHLHGLGSSSGHWRHLQFLSTSLQLGHACTEVLGLLAVLGLSPEHSGWQMRSCGSSSWQWHAEMSHGPEAWSEEKKNSRFFKGTVLKSNLCDILVDMALSLSFKR